MLSYFFPRTAFGFHGMRRMAGKSYPGQGSTARQGCEVTGERAHPSVSAPSIIIHK
jgi:hypothetical protein